MDKEGAILIIPVEGYFIPMHLYGFIFTVLQIQLSSLLPQKKFALILQIFNWVFACMNVRLMH